MCVHEHGDFATENNTMYFIRIHTHILNAYDRTERAQSGV